MTAVINCLFVFIGDGVESAGVGQHTHTHNDDGWGLNEDEWRGRRAKRGMVYGVLFADREHLGAIGR